MSRKLSIKSNLVEVHVSSWNTYIGNETLTDIIHNNIEEGIFHAKVTITIEEVGKDLQVTGNKPKPEQVENENEEV